MGGSYACLLVRDGLSLDGGLEVAKKCMRVSGAEQQGF